MFKKIEIWILYVAILLGVLLAIGVGILVRQGIEGRTSFGPISIRFLANPLVEFVRAPEQMLQYVLKPNKMRVNDPWDEQRDYWKVKGFKGSPHQKEMFLLLSRYDGTIEESVVELVDLTSFKVLHTWNPDIEYANSLTDQKNPEFKFINRDFGERRYAIRSPFLTDDGGLLIHDSTPLLKIDWCSKFVWLNQDENFHHSIEMDHEGNIWSPAHLYPFKAPAKYVGTDVASFNDDGMVKISPEGRTLFSKSISELLYENNMGHRVHGLGSESFYSDPIHLNDIEPVLTDSKYWKKGDVFLSLRAQSMVLLYRPSSNKVLWVGEGHYSYQHDVDILDDHRIVVFDNNLKFYPKPSVDDHSQLVIYDFQTEKYSTFLQPLLNDLNFSNPFQGVVEILSSDSAFVEESVNGRAFFIKDGKMKWQYVNSASDGNVYRLQWSRLIHRPEDIQKIKKLMSTKVCKNE